MLPPVKVEHRVDSFCAETCYCSERKKRADSIVVVVLCLFVMVINKFSDDI